jgi:hypothetical protein
MPDALNFASPSPDAQHTAHFVCAGEIRFGPLYFSLSVDGYAFGQRIFGDAHLWSPSSNLVAVQEWLTIDYSEGPITALVLIDLNLGREATVARATKGFVVPEAFESTIIVYREKYAAREVVQQFDLDAMELKEWKVLA